MSVNNCVLDNIVRDSYVRLCRPGAAVGTIYVLLFNVTVQIGKCNVNCYALNKAITITLLVKELLYIIVLCLMGCFPL